MAKKNDENCRIVTPEFRVSYPHVWKAQAMPGTNNAPKFSVTMLFPKDSDLTVIKDAIKCAKVAKFGADKTKWPKTLASPVQDGDGDAAIVKKTGERKEGYEGHWVVKASTNADQQPGVVGKDGQAIMNQTDFYAGCYARAAVLAYVWEFPKDSGKYGVGFILDHIQKLRDGKSFSGKKPVEQVFGPVSGHGNDNSESFDEDNFA